MTALQPPSPALSPAEGSNLRPPIHALSTMWSQGRFPGTGAGDDMDAFAAAAARLGFPHIEINYVIPADGVDQLLASNHVAVASLHSPTPRVKAATGRWSDALNLASLDEDERALAVQLAQRTIDLAARCRASYVVLHLGGIGDAAFEPERRLRSLYRQGVHDGDEVESLRRRARDLRAQGAVRHFPQARRSLAQLAAYAASAGWRVALGLENRYHFHEFPAIDETYELLAEYPPDLVGYWHDVGHAEVLDRLGLVDKYRWLTELKDRCLGAHVHDVDGLVDHRPPGRGTADWDYIAGGLPPRVPRVFEINQKTPEEQVAASIGFLRERGVLPPLATA